MVRRSGAGVAFSCGGLSNLASVGQDLNISNDRDLTSLEGLSGLTSVGGHFGIAGGDASAQAAVVVDGDGDLHRFGSAVGPAGDVDGDGFADVIVRVRYDDNVADNGGSAHLLLGNSAETGSPGGWQPAPRSLQASTDTPIPPGLRSTSPSTFDLSVFARSPFGRTGSKLQIEIEPLGTAFDGADLQILNTTWTDTGTAGAYVLGVLASLSPETAYHYRARVLYDPADGHPQLWSRWLSGGRSGDALGSHLWTDCAADTDGDGSCDAWDADADGDGDPDDTDCDDLDDSIFTGAPEVTGARVDQDCNGSDRRRRHG